MKYKVGDIFNSRLNNTAIQLIEIHLNTREYKYRDMNTGYIGIAFDELLDKFFNHVGTSAVGYHYTGPKAKDVCEHIAVNAGFRFHKHVCKKCDTLLPHLDNA